MNAQSGHNLVQLPTGRTPVSSIYRLRIPSILEFYEFRRDSTSYFYDIRRMTKQQPSSLFGRRLREARRLAGIPQDKLGVQIGLDEHTASARISRYETGVHEPPFEIALKLAKVLRVPAAYFYCYEDCLAELVLAWGQLPKSKHKHLRALLADSLAGSVAEKLSQ